MRSFASQVSIKSILTISLFFTFFFTCNSNTLLTEDHVLTFVNVTLVRDDGLQKVAHKLFCLNFSDILSEIYIFSGLKLTRLVTTTATGQVGHVCLAPAGGP